MWLWVVGVVGDGLSMLCLWLALLKNCETILIWYLCVSSIHVGEQRHYVHANYSVSSPYDTEVT